MEWWKNGILGLKNGKYLGFLYTTRAIYLKIDLIPLNPLFQYSAKASLRAQYSSTPRETLTAKPVISDLAQRTRFSMLE